MKYNFDKKNKCYDYEMVSEYDALTSKTCQCKHIITFHLTVHVICKYCGKIHFLNKKAEYNYMIKRRFAK